MLLAIALPVYALDQVTKWWILDRSNGVIGWNEPVIPGFFELYYLANTGAAFSMFKNNNAFFIGLCFVALAVLVVCTVRAVFRDRLSQAGAGLLAGGILGNLTDRLIHGHVVDFLLFDLHIRFADPWPAFNVADSSICVAAGLFILASFFEEKKNSRDAES
ncbi:MAG: signal peptidase II [Verrucomicrobiota bacterium]|nr:signal peptidase II [Verrucomicrobiota bacterium]